MKVVVYGKKWDTFKDPSTGKDVDYAKLYCISDFSASEKANHEGQQALIVSVSHATVKDVPVPCEADLSFDNNGRLFSIDILSTFSAVPD